MGTARDGQELGQPLKGSEEDRLEEIQHGENCTTPAVEVQERATRRAVRTHSSGVASLARMQQRRVGTTGLKVSRLGLGTLTWGRDTDEHEARDQLIAYTEAGGTLLDTAAGYGDGASEELIGTLLGDVVPRDDVVLATKAGISRRRGERETNASRGHLISTLDQSLRRLGVDHVDLWQVHTWVEDTPLEETLSALDYAVSSGRVSYAGISNYTGWQTAQAATWQAAVPGRARIASTQVEYSLLNRSSEHEVIPAAAALGIGVLPWSPLGRGVLTGKYRHGTPSDSRGASPHFSNFVGTYLGEQHNRVVEAVVRAGEGLDWTPLEVALVWVRDRPGVTAPIMGARTAAQLKAALGVDELTLPTEIIEALDDVSSGD